MDGRQERYGLLEGKNMDYLEIFCLQSAKVMLLIWGCWGVLHLVDYPITKILKIAHSYWIVVEFIWYRKRFNKWLSESKVNRITSDGKWASTIGDTDRGDDL